MTMAQPNIATAEKLRQRTRQALEAFQQIVDIAVNHYVANQSSESAHPWQDTLEDCLSQINKTTKQVSQTALAARATCAQLSIASDADYLPLPLEEDSRTPRASPVVLPAETLKQKPPSENGSILATKGSCIVSQTAFVLVSRRAKIQERIGLAKLASLLSNLSMRRNLT